MFFRPRLSSFFRHELLCLSHTTADIRLAFLPHDCVSWDLVSVLYGCSKPQDCAKGNVYQVKPLGTLMKVNQALCTVKHNEGCSQ